MNGAQTQKRPLYLTALILIVVLGGSSIAFLAAKGRLLRSRVSAQQNRAIAEHILGVARDELQEPDLAPLAQDAGAEVYRVILLPPFHPPTCVRLVGNGRALTLSAACLEPSPGKKATSKLSRLEAEVLPEAAEGIRSEIETLKPWTMPACDKVQGLDGSAWVLEVVNDGRYCIVYRWSPDHDAATRGLRQYAKVCRLILSQAKWDTEE